MGAVLRRGAGVDLARDRLRIEIVERWLVPDEELMGMPLAPNAQPDPDPVLRALDALAEEQRRLHEAEFRRTISAVAAWRTALADEGAPGAVDTPYQCGFLVDLGLALQVSERTAKILVSTADLLERGMPAVWARFARGDAGWRTMQIVSAAAEGLDPAVLPRFDEAAAERIGTTPVPRLGEVLRRVRERLQASTADDRHERARQQRRVIVEPGPDGMGWLHAHLPATTLLAVEHQLAKAAIAAAGAEGETRGVGVLKADVLEDVLLQGLRRDADPADPALRVPARRGVEPRISILIPAMTALGHAAVPPVLAGYGPIRIRTALRLAGTAKSWVRVLTDPFTGAPVSLGREKYRPTKDMRRLIRLLDGGGRGPGCPQGPDQPDIDHVRSFRLHGEDGATEIDNLVLLSRRHHGITTAGEVDVGLLPDRTLVWRNASTGAVHLTRPQDPPEPTPIPPGLLDEDDCPF
ncbi:HNH endonuclease signature motif containing protein [Amnibacterium setariae]|uniref:HNH endonuclease n=1 Tax=Amnibacterium setariae TaxID=2306585 RepID=A0A3A1U2W4_9MICO|nr:HNH endonuclease signature motif containing protein [Amnibacterium setariae]RIX30640.1 HNH endonuclease [Amnibacterium setariae]